MGSYLYKVRMILNRVKTGNPHIRNMIPYIKEPGGKWKMANVSGVINNELAEKGKPNVKQINKRHR